MGWGCTGGGAGFLFILKLRGTEDEKGWKPLLYVIYHFYFATKSEQMHACFLLFWEELSIVTFKPSFSLQNQTVKNVVVYFIGIF